MPAPFQVESVVRVLDEERVVRRADDARARFAREREEETCDPEGVRLIEPGGRLVGEEEPRAGGNGARDRDALTLTRREVGDPALRGPGEADGGERLRGAGARLLAAGSPAAPRAGTVTCVA